MLTKFDVRSCRVKGISFHKSRSWVLCGLHNGTAQIWDYRMNTSVDTYTEHNGSVRGVDFHDTQPIFVTGGDDYLIKVWNYKLRRCLFTLKGHMDYIRVTFFHREQPWIISSSDDFTVRIWNWQSRSSVACLPGHNHYVMCAQFHPTQDLVVSASLDRTIRVWDISCLRYRKQKQGFAQDLIGTDDVALKYILEGHEKGVNWVCFHPTRQYIASASDDRTVRIWRMMDTSCHEEVQLRGHTNNVSCVTYMNDFLISNGEDRTVRVWDVKTRSSIMVFRRESDRYWILSTLPQKNLIAAGHDTGLLVFKLFRERPAWTFNGKVLHYVYENMIYSHDTETKEVYKFNLSPHLYPPRTISCNPVDSTAVVWYDDDSGGMELLSIRRSGHAVGADVRKRTGVTDSLFFAPNRYVFLDKNKKMILGNVQGERDKPICEEMSFIRLFPGPVGHILRQTDEGVQLYHMAQQSVMAEAPITDIKYVVWDKEFNKVAFVGRSVINVMTRRFKNTAIVVETGSRIKGAAFDEQRNIMYYTTSNHLKYCNLRNGECSTIQTLADPLYLVRASGDTIWALTRCGQVVLKEIDNLELNFKLKLQQQSYREVIKIIRKKQLRGESLAGYLRKHGHSEIALHFVSDPLTRFNLAVECGVMDIARATAIELNQATVWRRLAEAATKYGDIHLAHLAHTKSGNYHGAGLLSLITGNINALSHLVSTTADENFKLHYGLYLNDVEQRVKTLINAGQLPLAYLAAKSGGLEDLAASLQEEMGPEVVSNLQHISLRKTSEVPVPAPVIDNWPMLQVEESVFSRLLNEPAQLSAMAVELEAEENDDEAEAGAGWDDDSHNAENDIEPLGSENADHGDAAGDGWGDDLDIELPPERATERSSIGPYVVPTEHPPVPQHWVESSSIPAYHAAAGSFSTAFNLLRRQIGLGDPMPLKAYAMELWVAANASRPAWLLPSSVYALTTFPSEEQRGTAFHSPLLPDYIPQLTERLRAGYAAFVGGHFSEAQLQFVGALHQAVFATYHDEKQRAALVEITSTASEYARALNVQLHCRSVDGNSKEALELSLYFTHFKLQRSHLTLALSQAMSKAYKKKNFKTAASVARRLLDLDPPKTKASQATQIVAECERNPTDAEPADYDERNPFVLCSVTHKPVYKGTVDLIRCGYCFSPALPAYKSTVCPVCKIALLGAESSGLSNRT
uniref:Coatomer subunit alpha n=1 Tax=Trypanosoma congolense (strain IL3000) TaxID=1068625 RepID=G0UKN1_TRYCI|nr:unnamed protein product [Trypanosoma congolense IL3000]